MFEKRYLHGAVMLLEGEESPDDIREKCRGAIGLGLDTVVIWPPVFYHRGEPDFSVQKRFLEIAEEFSLRVVVELTGQVPDLEYLPDSRWKAEYEVTNPDGTPHPGQNGLGELNYNHPEVRAALMAFFRNAVSALKSYPALLAWDVWNETHFLSFDRWTWVLFQQFLAGKYGSIDELNRVWKKSYSDFSEIRHDPVTWASIAPDCDWEEFRTDNLAAIARDWADAVRALDPAHPVIADNVMSNAVWSEFDRGTDDWKLSKAVDRFGVSFYPKTGGRLLKDNAPFLRCLTFAGARSAGGGEFMISEMQSHCYSEIFTPERCDVEDLLSWNLEALFSGCRGNVYWKYEPFHAGFQLGGRGLVLADGSYSCRAAAVKDFSKLLSDHPELHNIKPLASCAVLYDRMANLTVKAMNNRVAHLIGNDQCARARFGAAEWAFRHNVTLDVLTPEQFQTASPELLLLPYQPVLSSVLAARLRAYLEAGGSIAAGSPFGKIDEEYHLERQLPGGSLHDLLSVRAVDNRMDSFCGVPLELEELEVPEGADVLLRTDSHAPLLLRKVVGNGVLFYCASPFWMEGYDSKNKTLVDAVGAALLEIPRVRSVPADVSVLAARGSEHDFLLVPNYEKKAVCRLEFSGEAKIIFGTGTLAAAGKNCWEISGAALTVLECEKGAFSL